MPSTKDYNNNVSLITTKTEDYSFSNDNLNKFIIIDSSNSYLGLNKLQPEHSIDISGENIKADNYYFKNIYYDNSLNNTKLSLITKLNEIITNLNSLTAPANNITLLN